MASGEGHTAVVSILLDSGLDVNRGDRRGFVPLMAAAERGHVAVVDILLSRKEIEIDRRHPADYTAIWSASNRGHLEVVRRLLAAGADPRIAAIYGRTPLERARQGGHAECIQLLEVRCLSLICPSYPHPFHPFLPLLF